MSLMRFLASSKSGTTLVGRGRDDLLILRIPSWLALNSYFKFEARFLFVAKVES
jgi:hypothetical protein